MDATEPISAVVVRIPLPRPLGRLRARWEPVAAVGVPPHVTILFPFLPADRLVPTVRGELVTIASSIEPFGVRFTTVARFPTVVYLAPEPSAPFLDLIEAVTARFPGYPPYGGAFDTIVPHLTICDSTEASAESIAALAARSLPFERRISSVEVLVEGRDAPWRGRWRIPLGVRR